MGLGTSLNPSPLAGEDGRRSLTDEGLLDLGQTRPSSDFGESPHPALTGHLLPQGEKEQLYPPRRDRAAEGLGGAPGLRPEKM